MRPLHDAAPSRSRWLGIAVAVGMLLSLLPAASARAQCYPTPPFFPLAPVPLEVSLEFPVQQVDARLVVHDQTLADWMWQIAQNLCPPLGVAGTVATGNGGYNAGWSWHWEPSSLFLWQTITEVCDSPPELVEQDLGAWVGSTYCPWGGNIVAAGPAAFLPADISVDGAVDSDDLASMAPCLGVSESPCWDVAPGCCAADLDGDEHATCADWEILEAAWTDPVAPQVPAACAANVPALGPRAIGALAGLLGLAGAVVLAARTRPG